MNRYGPNIPGLDINKINQFNSDFGDNNLLKKQMQMKQRLDQQKQIQKQQELINLKKQMEVKKQQELQNLINIENKKKALNNNTEKKPIKISLKEMEEIDNNRRLEKRRQQDEFLRRETEYNNKDDLINNVFPNINNEGQILEDRNKDIQLKDSKILNSLMEQQKQKEEKLSITENVDNNIELNEIEFNQFKSLVKSWLSYDDEIRILQNALKDRRAKKNELTPKVMDFMKNHDIEDLNTKDGKLRCYTSNRKKALTQKDIKHKLLGYFKNENKGEKCVEYIFGDREIKEVMNLRRTFKKK